MGSRGGNKFDVYASPFVPDALRKVNTFHVPIVPSAAPAQFDISVYLSRFFGSDLLTQSSPSYSGGPGEQPSALPIFPNGDPDVEVLAPVTYLDHFQSALRCESIALLKECDSHSLFKVNIRRNQYDPRPSIFTLHVPGLRERSLRIDVGDRVQLRQLYPYPAPREGQVFYGTDYQYDSVVWTIDRREETLSLRIDGLFYGSLLFNVCFTVQEWRMRALHGSVFSAQQALRSKDELNWLRSMLFPAEGDGAVSEVMARVVYLEIWSCARPFYSTCTVLDMS